MGAPNRPLTRPSPHTVFLLHPSPHISYGAHGNWNSVKKPWQNVKFEFSGILLQTFGRCFADKNKLNLHDGQFKQWWFFLRWIARLHITFLWPWKGNLRGIGNWRLRMMNEIAKNNLLFCIYFRSLFQPEMDLKWVISEEERTRHDALFYSQKPKDQYLAGEKMCDVWKRWRLRSRSSVQIFLHIFLLYFSGEQARSLFIRSKLPLPELSKIWLV